VIKYPRLLHFFFDERKTENQKKREKKRKMASWCEDVYAHKKRTPLSSHPLSQFVYHCFMIARNHCETPRYVLYDKDHGEYHSVAAIYSMTLDEVSARSAILSGASSSTTTTTKSSVDGAPVAIIKSIHDYNVEAFAENFAAFFYQAVEEGFIETVHFPDAGSLPTSEKALKKQRRLDDLMESVTEAMQELRNKDEDDVKDEDGVKDEDDV
jgi:hypothetical protein